MNDNDKLKDNDKFDAAALTLAALAGALTSMVTPGPYDIMSGVVGVTILLILGGYEFPRSGKEKIKSIAFAAVCSFISLLVVGMVLEYLLGPNHPLKTDPYGVAHTSNVPSWGLAVIWFVITILVYWVDWGKQSMKDTRPVPLKNEPGESHKFNSRARSISHIQKKKSLSTAKKRKQMNFPPPPLNGLRGFFGFIDNI